MDPTVIHRLKNKLAIILGFCDLLVSELPEGDRHRADVLEIQQAARLALLELPASPAHDFTGVFKAQDAPDQ